MIDRCGGGVVLFRRARAFRDRRRGVVAGGFFRSGRDRASEELLGRDFPGELHRNGFGRWAAPLREVRRQMVFLNNLLDLEKYRAMLGAFSALACSPKRSSGPPGFGRGGPIGLERIWFHCFERFPRVGGCSWSHAEVRDCWSVFPSGEKQLKTTGTEDRDTAVSRGRRAIRFGGSEKLACSERKENTLRK